MGAGGLPSSYMNELNGQAVRAASLPQFDADVGAHLSNDRAYSARSFGYSRSFSQSNQDLSCSENCTPFIPMDIEPILDWYSDTVVNGMGLTEGLDDIDEQTMGWMEGLGGLLSFDVDVSLAGTDSRT